MSKNFKQSSQYRANLTGSPKIQRQAKEQKKQKWGFISRKFKQVTPLERLSRQFAFQWKLKQSQKAHFFVKGENKYQNALKWTKKIKGTENQTKTVDLLFSFWESRLDVSLFKSHLSASIPISRKLIKKGFVFVNGKKITMPSKILKKGDFVQIQFLNDLQSRSSKTMKENLSFKHCTKDLKLPFFSENSLSKFILSPKFMEEFSKNQLTKNLLQQTLFQQTSGFDHSFFLKNPDISLYYLMLFKNKANLREKLPKLPISLPHSFSYKSPSSA